MLPALLAALLLLAPPTTDPALFTEGTPSGKARKKPAPPLAPDVFGKLVNELGPAVVFVRAIHRAAEGSTGRAPSLGTGFVISKDGYLVTNHHVIDSADEVRIRLHDERWLAAEVVGTDVRSDVALLKVDPPSPLPIARLGDSDGLHVGEWVIAIGNPWNFDHTVTAGIVSALGRQDVKPATNAQMFANFIQTDAAINKGNSGGPLINLRGEVIGINSAIFRPSREGGAEGINFAIPINMAKQLLPVLRKHGNVPRSWLGLEAQAVSPWLQQAFGLPAREGALVASVHESSPASRAGLRPGDVVVELDGRRVLKHTDLEWRVSLVAPGTPVPLRVLRQGKPLAMVVNLVQGPSGGEPAQERRPRVRRPPSQIGIAVTEITATLARQRSLPAAQGVVVTDVDDGSPALEAGVQRDDVVLRLGTTDVRSIDDYVKALRAVKPGGVILLLLSRSGERQWAAFPRR
jgi:serine protease Do